MLSAEDIVKIMRSNYEPLVKTLPLELQEEFRTRVLPLKEMEELAPFIRTSTEFEGRAATGLTQRKIGRKVAVMAFNKKLIAAGVRPDDIYGGLLKGCFVFD
jgi:hypothetical protein